MASDLRTKRRHQGELAFALALVTVTALQCKKEPANRAPAPPPADAGGATARALPADEAWSTGSIRGAVVELTTRLRLAGPQPPAELAARVPPLTQTLHVTDGRGRLTFTTPSHYIPPDTQLRYVARGNRYLLADPTSRRYWTMDGGELANLLEGGPQLKRSDYEIAISDSAQRRTIAGFEARRSEAKLRLRYRVDSPRARQQGTVSLTFEIWHTADERLPATWGDTVVALMALPFQDAEGRGVVEQLQQRLDFPLAWSLHVNRARSDGEPSAFNAATTAVSLRIVDIPRPAFAWPPARYRVAKAPYTFGEDGQTLAPEVLQQLVPETAPPEPARRAPPGERR